MTLRLEVHTDAEAAARRVAALVRERLTDRPGAPRGSEPPSALFALALSRARRALLAALAGGGLPWEDVAVYQVDERVAPAGSDDRNATALLATLPAGRLHLMPVDDEDLDGAAACYEASLPHR
ncbi:MAG TPA: 6-phosphogluconolactonase, partial [Gaiellaceae bacterium]|nr:6-phosphogluconolactonase [Gaiellaceae bacterium]